MFEESTYLGSRKVNYLVMYVLEPNEGQQGFDFPFFFWTAKNKRNSIVGFDIIGDNLLVGFDRPLDVLSNTQELDKN